MRRNVPLKISAKEFLSRIALRLDASAGTVIQYFEAKVGRAAALREVHELRTATTDPTMLKGLDACRYWLGELPAAE
ncbi:MAG TPA: hypothetical protein VFG14_12425 [Chthoniobacteraceae bacterium]|nr:hypothetical protein [Chthoniobacteraceae bacterium]